MVTISWPFRYSVSGRSTGTLVSTAAPVWSMPETVRVSRGSRGSGATMNSFIQQPQRQTVDRLARHQRGHRFGQFSQSVALGQRGQDAGALAREALRHQARRTMFQSHAHVLAAIRLLFVGKAAGDGEA